MERLTFEGNFCDIAMCSETPGGSFCEDGSCSQRKVWERLKAIEDILGDEYDLDRLRELAQADREGRCVVLPCKPSDVTVYQLRNKKHARGVGVSPRHIYCATVWANGNYALHHQGVDACLKRDFNKTWFLNEEEAEAALRREQDG